MSDAARQQFVDSCLLLDLETTRDGRLRRIGAVLGERTFERQGERQSERNGHHSVSFHDC